MIVKYNNNIVKLKIKVKTKFKNINKLKTKLPWVLRKKDLT